MDTHVNTGGRFQLYPFMSNQQRHPSIPRRHFFPSFFPATLQTCSQSCTRPWRVLFLERQSRLRHFESPRVRDSWAEALWTQNEDDWIWGWLCSSCTIVCTNHDVFTLWGFHVLSQESKCGKKGPCGFLFIPLQEQLPHNKVAKFSNCTWLSHLQNVEREKLKSTQTMSKYACLCFHASNSK